jgi:hypothetical protein
MATLTDFSVLPLLATRAPALIKAPAIAKPIPRLLPGYSGQTGHSFRFKTATDRSEATLDGHYTSLWPE